MPEPLTSDLVVSHLYRRGILSSDDQLAAVTRLAGGISGDTFAVDVAATPGAEGEGERQRAGGRGPDVAHSLVVKRALPQLRVAHRWDADPRRTVIEGLALQLVATLVPGAVPDVVDIDPATNTLTLRHAHPGWIDWKSQMFDGRIDARVGTWVGDLLGTIHRRTWNDPALDTAFGDRSGIESLRLVPYHEASGRQRPQLAAAIKPYLHELRQPGPRRCLVHGDASPKNVLVGPAGIWLIDFEATHLGDPVFDAAFLVNHLLLKTVHGLDAHALHRAAEAFWSAYQAALGRERTPSIPRLLGHVGCLMVARVLGWSRVEYLDDRGLDRALALGTRLITDPPGALDSAWAMARDTDVE